MLEATLTLKVRGIEVFIEKGMSNPPEELRWEELVGVEDFKKEVSRITTKFKLDIQEMNSLLAEALLKDVEDFTIYHKIGLIYSMKGGGHYGDK